MIGLSKLTDYAIVVLTRMAISDRRVHTAAELAGHSRIPLPTVSKVLKALKKGGLLRSQRGVTGGYSLAREPSDISVAQVIAVMEGPVAMTECSASRGVCALEASCTVRGAWGVLSNRIRGVLEQVSLQEMARPASQAPTTAGEPHLGGLR